MDTADLESAAAMAAETERRAAAEYRAEIAEDDAAGRETLGPKGRAWVIAYDELKAARDELEADRR